MAIGASAAAIIVALALLYMWAVVLEGTGSGPGVLGGIAFTAGVALFGLVLLLLGHWSSMGALLLALVLGAALGAAAGYLLGAWVADSITRCIDGLSRSVCGTPWLDHDVITPAEAPLAYAPFGTAVGSATSILFLGLLAGVGARGVSDSTETS